ncbi:dUTP diphosphatase [bacterium]|nr:dUTP diphosphatase [bacterium]
MQCVLKLIQEPGNEDLPVPFYQTDGSAGMDLYAAVTDMVTLSPGQVTLVPTGIRIALPHGYEAQIRPRSGLALKHGIGLLNSPGTVDSDYRGVIGVVLFNFGPGPFVIKRGDRIAQMVISKVETAVIRIVNALDGTGRGDGGFGSTGSG